MLPLRIRPASLVRNLAKGLQFHRHLCASLSTPIRCVFCKLCARACDVIAGAGVPNWLLLCPYATLPTRDDVFGIFFFFWTSLPIQVTGGSGEIFVCPSTKDAISFRNDRHQQQQLKTPATWHITGSLQTRDAGRPIFLKLLKRKLQKEILPSTSPCLSTCLR